MRATLHNARTTKGGKVFSPRHNDRSFDLGKAKHIDPEREKNNVYWGLDAGKNYLEQEQKYYKKNFSEIINKKNQKAILARHPERVITTEDYRSNPRTCPEETIMQIGDMDNHASKDELMAVLNEYIKWHVETYPQVHILSLAVHMDEATPHVHIRRVWTAKDKDGDLCISERKSLAQMGVERPHPDAPESKYNNAKITYTATCRNQFEEIVKNHGFVLAPGRLDKSKTGYDLLQYQLAKDARAQGHKIKDHYFCVAAKAALSPEVYQQIDHAAELAADSMLPDDVAAELAKKISTPATRPARAAARFL